MDKLCKIPGMFCVSNPIHKILQKVVLGECARVSTSDYKQNVLKEILHEHTPENIYNANESDLFFKLSLNNTLIFKNDTCFGDKQRRTVLVAA